VRRAIVWVAVVVAVDLTVTSVGVGLSSSPKYHEVASLAAVTVEVLRAVSYQSSISRIVNQEATHAATIVERHRNWMESAGSAKGYSKH